MQLQNISGKIKLSEDTVKIVNPGYKKLYRVYDKDTGYAISDVMCEYDEELSNDEMVIVSTKDYLKSKKNDIDAISTWE